MRETISRLESENEQLQLEKKISEKNHVAELKALTAQLIDSEHSRLENSRDLRSVLDNMPSLIGYWDRNLHNRFGNKAYASWFGVNPEQMTGKHIRDVIGEERYQLNLPYIEAALRGEPQRFERAITTPDQTQIRHSLAEYIPDIVDGVVFGFYVQVSDITSVKNTEYFLREAQRLGGIGSFCLDMRSGLWSSSEVLDDIFGINADYVKTVESWLQIVHPEERDSLGSFWQKSAANRSRFDSEYRIVRASDGEIRWVHGFGNFILDEGGKPIQFIGSIQDITDRKLKDERLQQKMEMIQLREQALSQISQGVIITGADSRTTFVNEELTRITGYCLEEMLGQTMSLLQGPGSQPDEVKRIRTVLDDKQPYKGEILNYRKDGTPFWNDLSISPVFNQAGEVSQYVGVVRDITLQKKNLHELTLLRNCINQANDVFVITEAEPFDLPGPRIVFVNDAHERTTGYTREQTIGATPRMLQGPGTDPATIKRMGQALRQWKPVREEVLNYTRDGRAFWNELNIAPMADEKGWYTHWVSVQRDITSRKQTMLDLANAHETLGRTSRTLRLLKDVNIAVAKAKSEQQLLEDLCRLICTDSDYLLAWVGYAQDDPDKTVRIMACAGKVVDYLPNLKVSWDESSPYGKGPSGLAIQTGKTQIINNIADAPEMLPWREMTRDSGFASIIAVPLETKSAFRACFTICAAKADVFAADEVRLLEEMASNISFGLDTLAERGLRIEAESASLTKSNFLATMSHEIRTPMNAILGMGYLLQKKALPDDAQHLVRKIRAAGSSLLGILNDVLDFSKIESGKLEIQSQHFDINDVLENVASIMSASAQDNELEMVIVPPPLIRNLLLGDSLRLEQVLINLTGNAIKFTQRGHVSLKVDVESEYKDGITLRFAVRDTGIGISQDNQQLIFSAFTQADVSTSRKYGGSGLGLAISRRLVNAMGGNLQVSSVLGQGSEFWFSLPFKCTRENANTEAFAAISGRLPSVNDVNVLIANDNLVTREALARIAQGRGWQCTVLDSGDALLQHMRGHVPVGKIPTVVLLDYNMQGKDGLQVTHAVRHELRHYSDAIVILVTAYDNEKLKCNPDVGLVDAILSKPLTTIALNDAVMRTLNQRMGGLTPPAEQTRTLRLQGLRMLIVDDSDFNLEVAQGIFEGEGALVFQADNGQEALNWLHANEGAVDLVLMDVQMPVMDGYEATKQIRRVDAWKDLPVVALTAGAFVEHQEKANNAGMSGFLPKPFEVEKGIELILQITGHTSVAHAVQVVDANEAPHSDSSGLPGLAIAKALTIWRDSAKYQTFLRKFANQYKDVVRVLREANAADGLAVAHKLRGAASNLGMDEVAAAALSLEHIFRQRNEPQRALQNLQKAIKTALTSVARYAPPDSPVQSALPVNQTDIAEWLPRLLEAWHSDSSSNVEQVLAEKSHALPAQSRVMLQTALLNYDFRAGEATTTALIQSLQAGHADKGSC